MSRLFAFAVIAFFWLPLSAALADARCVQQFLSETAFDPGVVDGQWGRKTSAALDGFLSQLGETISGGADRNNAAEICSFLTGPRTAELADRGAFKIYAVAIDPDDLPGEINQTGFDFAQVAIFTDQSFQCRFVISREQRENGRVEQLATGALQIVDGRIWFDDHRWETGGLADESYLQDEANLVLSQNGQIIGKMPYFHLYIELGAVAEPPLYVTLSENFDEFGSFPHGTTTFEVDFWQNGKFMLNGCRELT